MKRLIYALPVVAAVLFLQPTIEKKGSFDLTIAPAGTADQLQVWRKGSFDVTFNLAGGKDPEDPVVTG